MNQTSILILKITISDDFSGDIENYYTLSLMDFVNTTTT